MVGVKGRSGTGTRKKWSPEEDLILERLFPTATNEELLTALPGRTMPACRIHGWRLGFRITSTPRQGSLAPLLECSPEAAYWMGFIFADGHVGEHRLRIAVSRKDSEHLRRFARWLGPGFIVREEASAVVLTCQDRHVVPRLRERFDLRSRKTYEPPTRLPYDGALLRSFFCGLIDGDGHIGLQTGRGSCRLQVVAHLNWLPFLESLSRELDFGVTGTRSGGVGSTGTYARLSCSRHRDIVELMRFARSMDLPVLDRKWSQINENYKMKGDLRVRVQEMVDEGYTNPQIVAVTGCSYTLACGVRNGR